MSSQVRPTIWVVLLTNLIGPIELHLQLALAGSSNITGQWRLQEPNERIWSNVQGYLTARSSYVATQVCAIKLLRVRRSSSVSSRAPRTPALCQFDETITSQHWPFMALPDCPCASSGSQASSNPQVLMQSPDRGQMDRPLGRRNRLGLGMLDASPCHCLLFRLSTVLSA